MQTVLAALLCASVATARPAVSAARRADIQNVLLFDAAGITSDSGETSISQAVYSYSTTIDVSPISDFIQSTADDLGIEIGQDVLARAVERLTLFGTDGVEGVELTVQAEGCDGSLVLPATAEDGEDWGLARAIGSLGACGTDGVFASSIPDTEFTATVYPFSPDGFGVISDIDDTIKVTGTELLDVAANTLFAEPSPIEGMPELYASIAASVTSDFYYITGSPYQLYPFLHSFIQDTYPTAAGPINTKNLTLDDISSIWGFLADEDGTKNFKLAEIDRVHELFPKKTFLTVGDSSQADPEVYAESYRKYGDFIACIWIHLVDGGDNSDERFAEAFDGVPQEKWHLYNTTDIPALADVDLASGSC